MAAVVIVFSSRITIAIAIVSTGDVVEWIADTEVIAAGGALWNEEGIVLVGNHVVALLQLLLGNVSVPNTDTTAIFAQLSTASLAKARISTERMWKWLLMEWHVLFMGLSTECGWRPAIADATAPIAMGERR